MSAFTLIIDLFFDWTNYWILHFLSFLSPTSGVNFRRHLILNLPVENFLFYQFCAKGHLTY